MKYSLILAFLVVISCENNSSTGTNVETGLPDLIYKSYTDRIENELGLYNLKDFERDLEIRVYNDFTLGTPDRLIIIKQHDSIYQAGVYDYYIGYTKDERISVPLEEIHDNMQIDSATYFRLSPRQDWSTFMDSLQQFNLENQITQSNIKDFQNKISDGYAFIIEIRQGITYNFIVYTCPEYYHDPENIEITEFVNFIRRNLTHLMSCKN